MRDTHNSDKGAENFFSRLARAVEKMTGERDPYLEGMAYAAQFAPPLLQIRYIAVILLLVAMMLKRVLIVIIATAIVMLVLATRSSGAMRDVLFWGAGGLAFTFAILWVLRSLFSK